MDVGAHVTISHKDYLICKGPEDRLGMSEEESPFCPHSMYVRHMWVVQS
jgi:hypothetical protein